VLGERWMPVTKRLPVGELRAWPVTSLSKETDPVLFDYLFVLDENVVDTAAHDLARQVTHLYLCKPLGVYRLN